MSLRKLTDVLDSQTLFFARATLFADQFEGVLPALVRNEWPGVAEWIRDARRQSYVNCWHMNTHESFHMWQQYLAGEPGVVIQSSFRRLTESFAATGLAIFAGEIRYIDYSSDLLWGWNSNVNIFAPLMHKRLEFASDQEIRAIVNPLSGVALAARQNDQPGIRVDVGLDVLIDQIRLMPGADVTLRTTVESHLRAARLSKVVLASSIDAVPP